MNEHRNLTRTDDFSGGLTLELSKVRVLVPEAQGIAPRTKDFPIRLWRDGFG
jgi:hypothetical protein